MIFPCGLTGEQRYQLSQLAEVEGLTEQEYHHSRERIMAGERLFEREVMVVGSLVDYKESKRDKLTRIMALLREHGEVTNRQVVDALGIRYGQVSQQLMPVLEARGDIQRKTTLNDNGRMVYLWSLADDA